MISSFQNTGRSLSNKPVLVCTVWPSKIMIFVCTLKRVSPIRIIETKIFGFVGTKHENIQSNRTAYWLQTSARFQLSASCGARCEVLEASCISQTQSLGDPIPTPMSASQVGNFQIKTLGSVRVFRTWVKQDRKLEDTDIVLWWAFLSSF